MSLATLERRIRALEGRLHPSGGPLGQIELADKLGLTLDPWQQQLLTSAAPQTLVAGSRQSGKSFLAALLGLHEVLSGPGRLVLIVSPGERQSKLMFRRLMAFYRTLGRPVAATVENVLSLELANGSAVYALPGSEETVRGFSAVNLLLIDEAARVPDDMIAAVRPMLAVSGGRMVAVSSPWGRRGWFFQAWEDGGADWERYHVPASLCPRISPAFLEAERRAMPRLIFDSEYEAIFTEPEDAFFSAEQIARAFDASVVPLFDLEVA